MKTDFEKLVVARKYIAALEQENKLLKKEVVTQFKAAKASENALEKERNFREKMSSSEKRKIKADLHVQRLKDIIRRLQAELEATHKEKKKLVSQLIRMKAEERHRMHQSLIAKLKRLFQKNKNLI